MKVTHKVRFKLAHEEYLYLEGLAKFYYDHRIISRPTVHSLAKFATIKGANEWIQQQSLALEARKQRQKTTFPYTL